MMNSSLYGQSLKSRSIDKTFHRQDDDRPVGQRSAFHRQFRSCDVGVFKVGWQI